MEVHAGEGVLRFFEYVAERTDIALGMFNSPSSGYVMSAQEMAAIHHRIPAVVAVKEGVMDSTARSLALHALAPELVIWECDLIVYGAGWLQQGIVGPAQLGTAGYLFETPDRLVYREYWELIWSGHLAEAATSPGRRGSTPAAPPWARGWSSTQGGPTTSPTGVRPSSTRPRSSGCRSAITPSPGPPKVVLPEEAKVQIRSALEAAGMAGKALGVAGRRRRDRLRAVRSGRCGRPRRWSGRRRPDPARPLAEWSKPKT